MEDNSLARAVLYVWELLKDLWEFYSYPVAYIQNEFSLSEATSFILWAVYLITTLWLINWQLIYREWGRYWRKRRIREMQIAIDESFSTERQYSDGLDHKATEDYRLQYLNILRENNKKLDAIYEQLALIRIQQRDFNND